MKTFSLVLGLAIMIMLISACQNNIAGQADLPMEQYLTNKGGGGGAKYMNCIDSDGGQNFGVKGRVYGNTSNYTYYENWDTCVGQNTVKEWYCQVRNPRSLNYNCQNMGNYVCEDGACVVNETSNTCTDSDGGNNIFTWGYTYGNQYGNGTFENFSDSCYGNSVYEYICDGTTIMRQGQPCPNGYHCSYGACVENQTNQSNSCTDSDGGQYPYTFGQVTGIQDGQPYSHSDSCYNPTQVYEFYCDGDQWYGTPTTCDPSDTCVNGVCVPGTPSVCLDSDGGDRPNTPGNNTVVNASGTFNFKDTCQGTEGVYEYYCSNDLLFQNYHRCSFYGAYHCENDAQGRGFCAGNISCVDSDGGINPPTPGYVNGYGPGGIMYHWDDYCLNSNTLQESYCSGTTPLNTTINCTGNYTGCSGGRCV